MHCCSWAVLSSIPLVSVSSRRPRKALSEADFRRAPLVPGTRSYIVAGAVTKSPYSLSREQTKLSDAMLVRVPVARDCTAPETGRPEDREHEAHDACGDPGPGDEEQEEDPDDDECDRYADHGSRVPAPAERETSLTRRC